MARRCGTCCDCGYHSNRAKRPGKKWGGRSKKARGLRKIEQNMRGAMNAAVTWIGEQVPDAWEHLRCPSPSSRRRFLLSSLENMVLRGGSLADAFPENVLDHIPAQMIERISSLIAIKQETTPEEKELLAAHEVEENTLQTPPEAEEEKTKDNLEALDSDDDDEDKELKPPPPPFTLWPSSSSASSWLGPPRPPVPSTASSAEGAAMASAPVQDTRDAAVAPAPPTPVSVLLDGALASWEDVERGVFSNLTVATQFMSIEWPWTQPVRDEFMPPARGFWPWNNIKKRVTAFRNRVQGPQPATTSLQRGAWSSMQDFLDGGGVLGRIPPIPVMAELPVLCEWLAGRPEMAARIASLHVVPSISEWMPPGTWVRATLKEPVGHAYAGRWNHVGWHGTSMNNLTRTVVRGLAEGWSAIKEGTEDAIIGIYVMGPEAVDLCVTYSLYSPLQSSGYYYAPYLQVGYFYDVRTDWRKHVARRAGRATQYVTYPDVSYISAVYFHVVSTADMSVGDKQHWLNMEAERPVEMELNATEDDHALRQRSHLRWLQAKVRGQVPEARDE